MSNILNLKNKKGWIELITGCMFAGKTEEFIKRLRRYQYANQNIIVFKPAIDDRYGQKEIYSHSRMNIDAIPIQNSEELIKVFNEKNKNKNIDVIGIDEVQFLDENIVNVLDNFANKGIIVIASGLDKDFRNRPFKNVDKLLVNAEYIDKLTSICHKCGGNGTRTQRIIDGKPASLDSPLIFIAANEKYESRCRHCFEEPR
ncbi:thymidine kinase [Spiroplasma turonicum]|uniref:Thymidine kinase n=1 Tax=Spiroplasma turonicum TaxID=216946 RepID=A0A0K1P7K4_9MOLU|nr:thymidine kinase [Spiroplasma turonicum]AKU80291.1 thymidine kinase [Spiroplasma turonicum]ALX71292.1 thymidine kinase [Spiroplasma turonicum]